MDELKVYFDIASAIWLMIICGGFTYILYMIVRDDRRLEKEHKKKLSEQSE